MDAPCRSKEATRINIPEAAEKPGDKKGKKEKMEKRQKPSPAPVSSSDNNESNKQSMVLVEENPEPIRGSRAEIECSTYDLNPEPGKKGAARMKRSIRHCYYMTCIFVVIIMIVAIIAMGVLFAYRQISIADVIELFSTVTEGIEKAAETETASGLENFE